MFKKIRNPILVQGTIKKKHYFEGWYYKQVSSNEKKVISLIPGISLIDDDLHSFVQYIFLSFDENNNRIIESGYLKYPLKAFKFTDNPFMIQVGENFFSESRVVVKLLDEKINIEGTLELGAFTSIETSILMPNIMGLFAYIPKMECYHGVISMNHRVNGILKINDEEIDFSKGKGYIEKDWGTSFPKEYVWIQCNNFKNESTSVFASIANIPFLKKSFTGFICNLLLDGKQYRFATYNNSKQRIENIANGNVKLVFENTKARLNIEATSKIIGKLIAPQNGKMQTIVEEELSGEIRISLYSKPNKLIYEDIGYMAGIEILGF